MKNYEEVTRDLLERRDRYVTDQKKKRKRTISFATSLSCFCLIALLGFGMWRGGMFKAPQPDQTVGDAEYPGIKDNFDESKGESPTNPATNNIIVVHSIEDISPNRNSLPRFANDLIEMTRDEMKEYYGVDYVPDVPADIKPWDDERCGIYKRDGGTGEVYYDTDILNYSNEDYTRNVHLEVAKGGYPFFDCVIFEPTDEKSIINNIEVMIGQTESGFYYAEFMYKNVGFVLNADGVTQDEFVAILASILK